MQAPILHTIEGQRFWLSGERSVYWEEQGSLIVSDLHFGKTGHFRKSGIAVPQKIYQEDLQRLVSLLHYFKPRHLVVVGDFFHSHANMELDWFRKWRQDLQQLEITLVRGNHDILRDQWYEESGINLVEKELIIDHFIFTHDRCEERPGYFTFCGHLHPGVVVYGLGKQSLRFPCFYFSNDHCILPAFSRFTGMALIEPGPGEAVFAIVENSLIKMQ